jgi:dolichol-phosphate mannosyltransferase
MTSSSPPGSPGGVRILVVSPTYCEAENIEEFLRRTRAALPRADVLIVDDSSPDGTQSIVERVAEEVGQIFVLSRTTKDGLGTAYRAGFGWGLERGYDVLVEIDADLSHDPGALPTLIGSIAGHTDLVVGSRYVQGGSIPNWPWHRRAISRWGCRYAAFALRLRVRDTTSGYRAYRAEALRMADYEHTRANGYGFQIELVHRIVRQGGGVVEVPIVFSDRERGTSKMSGRIAFEAMYLVTRWALRDLFRRRPPRELSTASVRRGDPEGE